MGKISDKLKKPVVEKRFQKTPEKKVNNEEEKGDKGDGIEKKNIGEGNGSFVNFPKFFFHNTDQSKKENTPRKNNSCENLVPRENHNNSLGNQSDKGFGKKMKIFNTRGKLGEFQKKTIVGGILLKFSFFEKKSIKIKRKCDRTKYFFYQRRLHLCSYFFETPKKRGYKSSPYYKESNEYENVFFGKVHRRLKISFAVYRRIFFPSLFFVL